MSAGSQVVTEVCDLSFGDDLPLMIQMLYLKDPKLWELWYIPDSGSCRMSIISRSSRHRVG